MSTAEPTPSGHRNPSARAHTVPPVTDRPDVFHATLPGYAPTALRELPALAAELGVGRLFVKDESSRFGLGAFKGLGASWAVARALSPGVPTDLATVRRDRPDRTLVTATAGNHGRAVAWTARLLGLPARVFLPAGTTDAAAAAIAGEGAEIVPVDGPYDEAVRRAAEAAGATGGELVQDTAWPGYHRIPGWIVDGYSTMFREVDAQLAAAGAAPPGCVAVPVGVGSLAQAAVTHYRSDGARPALLSVEPDSAACALASLAAGHPVPVPTGHTPMAGLNAGQVSELAWPFLRDGVDAAVAISDDADAIAATDLARLGVPAGPCGAAGLAGLRASILGGLIDPPADGTVVLLSTEGSPGSAHAA